MLKMLMWTALLGTTLGICPMVHGVESSRPAMTSAAKDDGSQTNDDYWWKQGSYTNYNTALSWATYYQRQGYITDVTAESGYYHVWLWIAS